MNKHEDYLKIAIQLARENVEKGGGPFGAIIVRKGEIIAQSGNTVTLSNDPTAHAEVNAIRQACQKLQTYKLDDCVIYSSCEPCPMCLSAIYWAHLSQVFFAATRDDAARAGFDDSLIYTEIPKPVADRLVPFRHISLSEAQLPFRNWQENLEKKCY